MQIDFHHAVTYIVARYAGFAHREAEVIAHCAQYVDDATDSGIINFKNGAMYHRMASAHKMLDYRNLEALANHNVWLPFHFLPGNGGKPMGENPDQGFIQKIVCTPNSPIAQDMVRYTIATQDELYGLHRLGVAMHVYADTWAHQGFAGVCHEINNISMLDDQDQPDKSFFGKLKIKFGDQFDLQAGKFIGDKMPLGHGAALSFPDRPFLKWSYTDSQGNKVVRDNPKDFLEAADHLCKAMQRYRARNAEATVSGLDALAKQKLSTLFSSITDEEGEDRHKKWLEKIAQGYFGFPAVNLEYQAKDQGSWKQQATGTPLTDLSGVKYDYTPSFLGSDWKLFHDAVWAHRFDVIYDILPKYGICAA